MKKGSVIEIEFVGRIKESNQIFDLTLEKVAKENNLYTPKGEYGPRTIVVGADYVIKGLDSELERMGVGEENEVEISSEQAFGKRDPSLVKLISEKAFRKSGVRADIGSMITLGNSIGKIISKGAGRVRVDLNHPLAGKKLVYWIKINKEITKDDEKIKAILTYRLGVENGDFNLDFENKLVEVNIEDITDVMQEKITSDIQLCFPGIKNVKFK
jgi:FKBP-type peptidyl-prolyl cis-trans isomerase 2